MSTEGAGIKRSEKGTSVFDRMISALMNEVTDYAFDEENFFLYKTYLSSRSAQQDIDRLL